MPPPPVAHIPLRIETRSTAPVHLMILNIHVLQIKISNITVNLEPVSLLDCLIKFFQSDYYLFILFIYYKNEIQNFIYDNLPQNRFNGFTVE